jgi:glycosyltransferase involved in cell wall biosynthesis
MSLVLLEAMACASTVVTTDVAGAEILRGAGVIVPRARGASGLASATDDLLRNPAERTDLGRLARTRVCEHFPLEKALSAYLDQWNALFVVGRRRLRPPIPVSAEGQVA